MSTKKLHSIYNTFYYNTFTYIRPLSPRIECTLYSGFTQAGDSAGTGIFFISRIYCYFIRTIFPVRISAASSRDSDTNEHSCDALIPIYCELVHFCRADVHSCGALVQLYRADVHSWGALVPAYSALVQLYRADVHSWGALVPAYDALVQLYIADVQSHDALVPAYGALVQLYIADIQSHDALVPTHNVDVPTIGLFFCLLDSGCLKGEVIPPVFFFTYQFNSKELWS